MAFNRKKILLWLVIANFLLFFGGSINPFMFEDQLDRRLHPSSLLDPKSPKIREFNIKIENAIQVDKERTGLQNYSQNSTIYEIKLIEAYVLSYIEYTSDFIQYFTADHLATLNEVQITMRDDCDGRAIFACSLLLQRGFDAWVVVSWDHWWVEILLENENPLQILNQRFNAPWYMKFNETEKVIRRASLIGFVFYNIAFAAIIPFLIPLLYRILPQDSTLKLLLLLLGVIPFVCWIGFYLAS